MVFSSKKLLFVLILVSSLLCLISVANACLFTITKVVDGDTIRAEGNGIEVKVRLAGIDAPERSKNKNKPSQPFAERSKHFLTKLVFNKQVKLKGYAIGPYNRQIAEVFIDDINVNLEMIKQGMAQVYDGKHPRNLNLSDYVKAQTKAIREGVGIWSQKDYLTPSDWRKIHK